MTYLSPNIIRTTVTSKFANLHDFSQQAAVFCAMAFAFFIPISPALMNIFLFFTLLFILLSGNLKTFWKTAWNNPVARGGIMLFILFMIGTTWAIVDFKDSIIGLKKYNELWYIALLIPLFNTERRKEIGINIFLASMVLILLIVYSIYMNIIPQTIIPIGNYHSTVISVDGGFRTHIITNILMSFATFIFAQRTLLRKGYIRALYLIVFILSFYYAAFISTGTTGQILTIVLLSFLIFQHAKWLSIIIIPIFLSIILSYGYYNKNTSINIAIHKIVGGIKHDGSSASQRREFLYNSIYLAQENIWFGSGTGSIEHRYSQLPVDRIKTTLTTNPHNEYAAVLLQLGLLGLISLLFLYYVQYRESNKLSNIEQRYIAQGLILSFFIACFGNSMLMDSGEGHFWSYMSAVLFATIKPAK